MSSQYPVPQPQRPVVYAPAPVVLTDQQQPDTAVVIIAWVLTALSSLYLLPWAIAATRGKSNHITILLINLLLGWTVIGWIIAFIMCLTAHRPLTAAVGYAPVVLATPAGWYPDPSGSGYRRYFDGVRWTEHLA